MTPSVGVKILASYHSPPGGSSPFLRFEPSPPLRGEEGAEVDVDGGELVSLSSRVGCNVALKRSSSTPGNGPVGAAAEGVGADAEDGPNPISAHGSSFAGGIAAGGGAPKLLLLVDSGANGPPTPEKPPPPPPPKIPNGSSDGMDVGTNAMDDVGGGGCCDCWMIPPSKPPPPHGSRANCCCCCCCCCCGSG